MKDNIVNVDFKKKVENSTYDIHDGHLLAIKNSNVTVGSMTPNTFMISIADKMEVFSREGLSEFLWMAAYMVDSEQRWCPDELPAINYPITNGE
jgi:hypothetical protein